MTFAMHNASSPEIPESDGPEIRIDEPLEFGFGQDPFNSRVAANRSPYIAYASTSEDLNAHLRQYVTDRDLLYPRGREYARSETSSASVTPVPSRSPSPSPSLSASPSPGPLYLQSALQSSDSEDEHDSFLGESLRRRDSRDSRNGDRPRWWQSMATRRRRRDPRSWLRSGKRMFRKVIRHPYIPKTPITIILTLLLLTAFGVSLTFLLMYILNPDKAPVPWRGYCTIPEANDYPEPLSYTAYFPKQPSAGFSTPSFPPDDFETLPPAGVFLGVFSMDSSYERRQLIRSTYATHPRSRNGAGAGDGGNGTSRTIVRFIMGRPRSDMERRVKLEIDTYNDIIILPIAENMNDGKTHAFFTWAASNAWVPPLYLDQSSFKAVPTLSYSDQSTPAPSLAPHDPVHAHSDQRSTSPKPWVRPDFVVKADDDGFVMLAELEARLRVELHVPQNNSPDSASFSTTSDTASSAEDTHSSLSSRAPSPENDPLIYWGYLVKHRFMGGEMYALSHRLVNFVATDPQVKTMTRGAEDKTTASWMKVYPRPKDIRWARERCWIYDHPRAGTVYSHGFLFPSEVKRIQEGVLDDLQRRFVFSPRSSGNHSDLWPSPFGPSGIHPEEWVKSSVTAWHVRYAAPISNMTSSQSIEALVEGSPMSKLRESDHASVGSAYQRREGRNTRYEGKRLGGTIMVHFIKKHMWFLEAALALLGGDDVTELERDRHR